MGESIALTLYERSDLRKLPGAVEAFASANALGTKDVYALDLVLEELVSNVINHGAKDNRAKVEVMVVREGGQLVGTVRDNAAPYDPLSRPPVDTSEALEERSIGGLGIHLVRAMTNHLTYRHGHGHNVLSFSIDLTKDKK